jgi:hypothetical protein
MFIEVKFPTKLATSAVVKKRGRAPGNARVGTVAKLKGQGRVAATGHSKNTASNAFIPRFVY